MVAVSEGVLLAGSWVWVLRIKRNWPAGREKAALIGFLGSSAAIVADLILTMVMHFSGDSQFAAALFFGYRCLRVPVGDRRCGVRDFGQRHSEDRVFGMVICHPTFTRFHTSCDKIVITTKLPSFRCVHEYYYARA
jgi:hypothetical protein